MRRTILRLQVAMQNGHSAGRRLRPRRAREETKNITPNLWRIDAIVTAVESGDKLREDAPDEGLLCPLALQRQILDHPAEIAIAAILHVKVQILTRLEVLAVEVFDDVLVSEVGEDLELGVQLFTLLGRHLGVADLLAADDETIALAPDLSDDSKGAMACID